MIVEIPLTNVPSKIYKILLNNQEVTFKLYQKGRNMFFDLQVKDKQICHGAVCLNLVPIVQVASPDFAGNFVFADILGDTAPQFEELGERYFLVYFTEEEELPNIIKGDVGF